MSHTQNRFHLVKEAAFASALIVFIVFLLNILPFKVELINPIKQDFDDFDIYDLYFSGKADRQLQVDSDIIIVQVAQNRAAISDQIRKIESLTPDVIGADVIFGEQTDDKIVDDTLTKLLSDSNIVVAYKLIAGKEKP